VKQVFGGAVLALALLAAATPSAKADHFNCQLIAFSSFTMNAEPAGRVTIPIPVNGQTIQLLVDTGASVSIVNQTTAALSGSRVFREPGPVEMFGGYETHDYIILENPIFGHLKSSAHSFFVVADAVLPTVSGLLGGDILKNFDADFDFANKRLTIFSHDHCPENVVYWTKTPYARIPFELDRFRHIRLQVQLDGKQVPAMIDTGAASTIGSLEDIANVLHIDPKDGALVPVSGPGVTSGYHYPFKSLSFEGVTIFSPSITLVPNAVAKFPDDQRQLIIGMNVLRHLHMYVAYGEEALYLTDAAAH
jgi:predicted aspartyl protease